MVAPRLHRVQGWLGRSVSTLTGVLLASAAPVLASQSTSPVYVYGAGSYGTLSNFFFLCSAIFTDILHVRVMLCLAYLMLLLQVALGFPSHTQWTANAAASSAALGSIVWVSVTLALQLYGLVVLLLDELPVRLQGDDELLWRLFYRRCGITKREFSHVLRLGRWQHFKAGQVVERRQRDEPRAFIVFKGVINLVDSSGHAAAQPVASGQLLNLYLFNLFGVYIGFEHDTDKWDLLVAQTDVVAMTWSVEALMTMASGRASVALPNYWRSFMLYFMALEFHKVQLASPPYCSFGQPEPDPDGWAAGAMSVDISAPLRPEEHDRVTLKGVLRFMFGSISLRVPWGLRHHAGPKTGQMATSRVLVATRMCAHGGTQKLPEALHRKMPKSLRRADRVLVRQYTRTCERVDSAAKALAGAGGAAAVHCSIDERV